MQSGDAQTLSGWPPGAANPYAFVPTAFPSVFGARACDAAASDSLALNLQQPTTVPPRVPVQPPLEMAPMAMPSTAEALYQTYNQLPPTAPAHDDMQYQSVRVRQPSVKVYGSDFVATAGGPLAEMSPKAEVRAAAAAARKAAKDEAKRSAEDEAAAWQVAEGVEVTPEVGSMIRILQELFSTKHTSFSKPFVDVAEAKALGVAPHLVSVRAKLIAGSFSGIAAFAIAVRDVFAACYLAHGHPDNSTLSKKCERIDQIFEQQVTLLGAVQRSLCSLHVAPTSLLGGGDGGGSSTEATSSGRSFTGRRQTQVAAQSTMRLVEMRKQAEAAAAEHERHRLNKEKRENAIKEAEAWGEVAIDATVLETLRKSYDGASVCHFISSFVPVLGVPNFYLVELELALCFFADGSVLMRYVSSPRTMQHQTPFHTRRSAATHIVSTAHMPVPGTRPCHATPSKHTLP